MSFNITVANLKSPDRPIQVTFEVLGDLRSEICQQQAIKAIQSIDDFFDALNKADINQSDAVTYSIHAIDDEDLPY